MTVTRDGVAVLDCDRCGEAEVWQDVQVVGRPYQLSSYGRLTHPQTGLKAARVTGRGYPIFTFHFGSSWRDRRYVAVHNLVASTFIGLPSSGQEVNHKDGDKTHSCASNLEYMTRGENIKHAYRTGLRRANTEAANNARRRTA